MHRRAAYGDAERIRRRRWSMVVAGACDQHTYGCGRSTEASAAAKVFYFSRMLSLRVVAVTRSDCSAVGTW
jgi:hypothetical protein